METAVLQKRKLIVPDYDPMEGTLSFDQQKEKDDNELMEKYEQEKQEREQRLHHVKEEDGDQVIFPSTILPTFLTLFLLALWFNPFF